MDARQAFKFGFIANCIERGITDPVRIKEAAEKAAFWGELASGAGNLAKTLGSWGLALGLAAPPIAGGIVGHLASKATDLSDYDVDEAKNQEVIDEYRRQTDRLKREGVLRRYAVRGNKSPPRRASF